VFDVLKEVVGFYLGLNNVVLGGIKIWCEFVNLIDDFSLGYGNFEWAYCVFLGLCLLGIKVIVVLRLIWLVELIYDVLVI
jgi:hypothetical protein